MAANETITVRVGKVPGTVVDLKLKNDREYTVLEVLRLGAEELGRKNGRGRPAFEIRTEEEYEGKGGNPRVDIPKLNGRALAERRRMANGQERWLNIGWDHPVNDGDSVVIVPQIQGN